MQGGPLQNQCQSPPWQFTTQHGKRFDANQRLVLAVNSMEMPRLVVVIVESNNNSEKSRKFRHLISNCIWPMDGFAAFVSQ